LSSCHQGCVARRKREVERRHERAGHENPTEEFPKVRFGLEELFVVARFHEVLGSVPQREALSGRLRRDTAHEQGCRGMAGVDAFFDKTDLFAGMTR